MSEKTPKAVPAQLDVTENGSATFSGFHIPVGEVVSGAISAEALKRMQELAKKNGTTPEEEIAKFYSSVID